MAEQAWKWGERRSYEEAVELRAAIAKALAELPESSAFGDSNDEQRIELQCMLDTLDGALCGEGTEMIDRWGEVGSWLHGKDDALALTYLVTPRIKEQMRERNRRERGERQRRERGRRAYSGD